MTRDRSSSVVQSIASTVKDISDNVLSPENESVEARSLHNPILEEKSVITADVRLDQTRIRAQSLPSDSENIFLLEAKSKDQRTMDINSYPFIRSEQEKLTQDYLLKLNYNSVLDLEYISCINQSYDDAILSFKSDCDHNVEYLKLLSQQSKYITENLNSLSLNYDQVVKETEDFATHSAKLLQEQKILSQKAQELDHVMKMFEPLETISKTLITSGNNIIKTGKVQTILLQLQEYLDFFASHQSYQDAESYHLRYRQCMTRGLTLVRNFNIDFLKAKQSEISSKIAEKKLDAVSLDIIMYSEFSNDIEKQTDNTKFPSLVSIIVERCYSHDEYKGLLSEILAQYFKVRLNLISAYIELHSTVNNQAPSSNTESLQTIQTDIVLYCQRSISTYKKLLDKEYLQFLDYFPISNYDSNMQEFFSQELLSFCKQVFDPLYDDLRNRILRETKITELCHLTNLISSYFENHDEYREHMFIPYAELFEPILNDSQSRLIFRIQNFVDNKLLKYKPQAEDLQLGQRKNGNRRNSLLDEVEENLFPNLYVPVGKALTVLSNIYELVGPSVFDDMAHFIVHSCIYMLKNGALKLAIGHFGPVDAKLFYLSNLIMLKNQLNNFDIQFVRTETSVDFTSGILELIEIFRSGKLYVNFNSNGGLLELVKKSAPKVVNDMIDAKQEIELELANSVNDLVTECANIICAPVLSDDKKPLKEKSVSLNDNILIKIPHFCCQMKNYIEEDEIIGYLLGLLSKLIYSTYESYYKSCEEKISRLEDSEEFKEMMEPDTFLNFINESVAGVQDSFGEENAKLQFNESILDDAVALQEGNTDPSET